MTRWGYVFIGAALVLAAAAVNTGNNALMAVLGLGLGAYVVSGFWSRQVLAAVEVTAAPPRELFVGRPAMFEVTVHNRSRWLPAMGLLIRDEIGRVVVFEAMLAAKASARHTVERVPQRRGWQHIGGWRLEVLLPLGFFLKSKEVLRPVDVLVFPRLLPTAADPERRHSRRRSSELLAGRGREGDVTQLRGWRDGDDRRLVHWKQTARQQRLIVVDRQRTAAEPVVLVLDPRAGDPASEADRERFERRVSEVATAVVERLRGGAMVGLVVGRRRVAPAAGVVHAHRLLTPLAEVELEPLAPATPASLPETA